MKIFIFPGKSSCFYPTIFMCGKHKFMEKHTVHLLLETITTLKNIISSTDPSTLANRNARIILACNRSSYGKEYQLDIDSLCDKFNLSK